MPPTSLLSQPGANPSLVFPLPHLRGIALPDSGPQVHPNPTIHLPEALKALGTVDNTLVTVLF